MSEEINMTEIVERLSSACRQLSAIKTPANETAPVDRPAMWNRAILTLKAAVLELAANQTLLIRLMQSRETMSSEVKSVDEAGRQSENVKSADKAGGNGGESAKT